ncbi:ATP-dependent nuclease [Sulfurospirillum cavolei]|uniref:ATP-dependent nuclease n=1 Tax=Sulfurospirillum cavolei TaxID=366522 RepID=UPI003FA26014
MLKSVSIENFKQIQGPIGIDLNKINIIVGSNNAGKSTLMQAIQFLTSVCQTIGQIKNTTVSAEELIYTPIKDIYALAYNWNLTQATGFTIGFTFNNSENIHMDVYKGKNKNISIRFSEMFISPETHELLVDTTTPFSMYVPGLAGINPSEHYTTPSIVRKAVAKGNANNYFRNILYQLSKKTTEWKEFIQQFQHFFNNYNLEVEFDEAEYEYIEVYLTKNGEILPIDCAGAGMVQAIQILSYIHLFQPKVLLLDEPDSHLHPNNQRLLMQVIESVAQRDVCVVLATHSRHIVDNALLMDDVSIIWARNGTFEIIDSFKIPIFRIFSDIGAIDGMDRLMLPNKKSLILTEDEDTRPIKAIFESSGFNLEETVIWSYKGCTKIDTAIGVAHFARMNNPDIYIIAHRDSDYMTSEESDNFREKLLRADIKCFLTDGLDAESHFMSAEHLHSLYSNQISVEECQKIINEAILATEKDSIEKCASSLQRNSGMKLSLHDALKEGTKLYRSNIQRYCYGKKVMKQIKQFLQMVPALSSIRDEDIFKSSDAISSAFLTHSASEIWSPRN